MLVTKRAEILIKANPEEIWDFINDPVQWMASNPEEHYGTEFFTPDKKVRTGGCFYQRESVAGVRADMRGHFLYVKRPENVSWTGVAEHRLLGGLVKFRVPQSGIVTLERREDGVMMSHDMFIDFPDTWLGKLIAWYFSKFRDGEKRLHEHGQKELVYFKTQIERLSREGHGKPVSVTEAKGWERNAHA